MWERHGWVEYNWKDASVNRDKGCKWNFIWKQESNMIQIILSFVFYFNALGGKI